MAYHEVAMWEIRNVLERLTRRETRAGITRATGRSAATSRRYEREARARVGAGRCLAHRGST